MAFIRSFLLKVLLLAGVALAPVVMRPGHAEALTATYLFNLSTFTGTVPFEWTRMCNDPVNKELYVAFGDTVRIFNQTGMEIFRFGAYDLGAETIMDMTVNDEGDLLVLSYKQGEGYSVIISDYKGRRKGSFTIKDLPAEFSDFSPNRMVYQKGKLYFAQLAALKIVATDASGKFIEGYDVAPMINVADDKRMENDMFAFSMTKQGEFLFTVPSLATVYVMGADRNLRQFGQRGSGPGKFGVPAGIASDKEGNIYVSDTLRSVVLIFNKEFRFITEFGGRGVKAGAFIGPRDILVDGENRIYVSQLRKQGISVFQITSN